MKNIFKNISIRAVSSSVPKQVIDVDDFSEYFSQTEINKIKKTTGVNFLRTCKKETASDYCIYSAKQIINNLKLDSNSIDSIIFVSQTRDFIMPQTSNLIQKKLGLSKETLCYDIPQGCNGYINGLIFASSLISSGCSKKILLLAGDTSSKFINNNDRSLKLLFGDGGSATLIEKGNNNLYCLSKNDGDGYKNLIIKSGGFRNMINAESRKLKFDKDGNGRSDCDMFMDGMAVFNFVISNVPNLINEIIEYAELKKMKLIF